MTFSSEQIQRARELARKRRKRGAIQRLLTDEFNLRPAQCRALLITAMAGDAAENPGRSGERNPPARSHDRHRI